MVQPEENKVMRRISTCVYQSGFLTKTTLTSGGQSALL